MKKKDVNHLNRSELIDLVYQMDKSNKGLNTSVSEQIKQERCSDPNKKPQVHMLAVSSYFVMKCCNNVNVCITPSTWLLS